MGHGGASTAFLQVIQGADLTQHFEFVVMEETINERPFGSQTMPVSKVTKAHRSRNTARARWTTPYLQNFRQKQIAPVITAHTR
jgi:hypothetical protein